MRVPISVNRLLVVTGGGVLLGGVLLGGVVVGGGVVGAGVVGCDTGGWSGRVTGAMCSFSQDVKAAVKLRPARINRWVIFIVLFG